MQDKKTLITIIVLLAICLPAAIAGTYRSFTRETEGPTIVDDNPNHDLIYNNKAYFYYNDELLATYDCLGCKQTTTIIDDTGYHTNYFKEGTYALPAVLNPNIALINQNGVDYVYSILIGRTISNFAALKDYHVEHTSPVLIARNDEGKWGVVGITNDAFVPLVSYDYEYISLPAHIIDGKLDTSKFIALRDNYWYILNNDGTSSSDAARAEIVDFNTNYYVVYDNAYHIYDYDGQEYLASVTKSGVYAAGEYIMILDNASTLQVYQNCNSAPLQNIPLPAYTSMYFNQTDAGIEIILDGNLYQTIELG